MSVITRHGTHELRFTEDRFGRHYTCSCTLFSVTADVRQVQNSGSGPYEVLAPPTRECVVSRWQAHVDLQRLSCDMPWRTRRTA